MKTREIAEFLGGDQRGDGEVDIYGVAALKSADQGELAYLDRGRDLVESNASCVIVTSEEARQHYANSITVSDPKLAFAKVAAELHREDWKVQPNHPTAVIAESASVRADYVGAFVSVGENSYIGEGCRIHDGVRIGKNVNIRKFTVLHANSTVYDNVSIGDDCVIHSGAVIGADGFGYVKDENGIHVKFPQIGTVVIEDNVEIGANSCVDRGALGETRIGTGTKIDNLVQIAHNVQIGKNCIIVAMSGISGSSVLEDDVVLAGQVGIADHVTLKKGVVIAAKSAVYSNKVISNGIWAGIPARPVKAFKENFAALGSLPIIRREIRELKDRIESIEPFESE
jgi:UDP-3-O-[3-hydroxymyristoyl] glucosamine N-acyltransferase